MKIIVAPGTEIEIIENHLMQKNCGFIRSPEDTATHYLFKIENGHVRIWEMPRNQFELMLNVKDPTRF